MKKINSICVIDDDPITVFGITKMLRNIVECDEISTYQNGKQAIEGLKHLIDNKKNLPDIILLDINMPIMDGWQFLEEFIELPVPQKIHIHIITSSIDPMDVEKYEMFKGLTTHFIDFKNKPIRKDQMEQITNLF